MLFFIFYPHFLCHHLTFGAGIGMLLAGMLEYGGAPCGITLCFLGSFWGFFGCRFVVFPWHLHVGPAVELSSFPTNIPAAEGSLGEEQGAAKTSLLSQFLFGCLQRGKSLFLLCSNSPNIIQIFRSGREEGIVPQLPGLL